MVTSLQGTITVNWQKGTEMVVRIPQARASHQVIHRGFLAAHASWRKEVA